MKNECCGYPVHPACACVPEMSSDDYKELVESITKNGLNDSITMLDGAVLDGRNRLKACKEAGVAPHFEKYHGDDPIGFVMLKTKRRNMTASQKAAFAAGIMALYEAEAKERQATNARNVTATNKEKIPDSSKGQARDKAAKVIGVNPRYVQDAKKIKTEAPEVFERVANGEITISKAKQKLKPKKRKERGTYDDWRAFKSICDGIGEALSDLSKLRIDADHVIPARSLTEKLSSRLQTITNKIGA